jgi:hypothetical protein
MACVPSVLNLPPPCLVRYPDVSVQAGRGRHQQAPLLQPGSSGGVARLRLSQRSLTNQFRPTRPMKVSLLIPVLLLAVISLASAQFFGGGGTGHGRGYGFDRRDDFGGGGGGGPSRGGYYGHGRGGSVGPGYHGGSRGGGYGFDRGRGGAGREMGFFDRLFCKCPRGYCSYTHPMGGNFSPAVGAMQGQRLRTSNHNSITHLYPTKCPPQSEP